MITTANRMHTSAACRPLYRKTPEMIMLARWFFKFLRDTHPQRPCRAHSVCVCVCVSDIYVLYNIIAVRTMIGYYDIDGIVLSGTVCRPNDDKWLRRGRKNMERQKRKKNAKNTRSLTASRGAKSSLSLSRQLFFSVPPFNYMATKI